MLPELMNNCKLPRLTILACLALVLIGQALMTAPAHAQSSETQDKIRLMSAALRERDAGDLDAARSSLEELLKLAPDDVNVQRLLLAVNRDIERRDQGQPTVYGQAAAVEDFSPTGTAAQATTVMSVGPAEETETVVAEEVYIDTDNLDAILAAEAELQKQVLDNAKKSIADAKELIDVKRYNDADNLLAAAQSSLVLNTTTASTIEEIRELRGDIILDQGQEQLDQFNAAAAQVYLVEYREKLGDDERARAFEAKIQALEDDPWRQNPEELSTEFIENQGVVDDLLVQARAKMLYGDYEGASATLKEIEARDPNNPAAKSLQIQILELLRPTNYLDHDKTRDEMLQEVARSWQRPQIFDLKPPEIGVTGLTGILAKLQSIEIPRVSFAGVPLSRAIETLSELSVEYDPETDEEEDKGVNIVPSNWGGNDPLVSITLRNLTLDKILDFVTQSVDYTWDVQNEVVVVRPGEVGGFLETEFFPLSRATVIRLTGVGESAGGAAPVDPFAPAAAAPAGPSASDTEAALLSFFQKAGVPFESTAGASLAFDGTQLIVTQTPKNLEKMRNILRRYDQPKQVEIEAKFLEVNQGTLDELNFNWTVNAPLTAFANLPPTSTDVSSRSYAATGNQSLNDRFGINSQTSDLEVIRLGSPTLTLPQAAPDIPNQIDLGATGGLRADVTFGILGANVQAIIQALSRKSGSDLLSSPRLTVLSGRTAQIVVAQELRYPENYSDIESEVGTGGQSNTGAAGVTITAGTPQDFTVRNVGVEMEVTPSVEENQNISLKLEPRVTEFEGFVEYGGTSIAISGQTTVTVPSGFYQPIFSTREVRTEVTVYDGATVVIGGLTREEIKTVNDKVPVLGDIPLIGRLFQSKGETSAKRNLLIFVTANLISPGGSPSQQRLRNVEANSLFQSPILVTPGGGVSREIRED